MKTRAVLKWPVREALLAYVSWLREVARRRRLVEELQATIIAAAGVRPPEIPVPEVLKRND